MVPEITPKTSTDSRLLPHRPEVTALDRDVEFIDFDNASDIFNVLSSTTARTILASLYRNPGPASDLANRVDTSLQNVTYHLARLQNVGLVTVVARWYSAKGREMNVYAPTNEPLVLIAGPANETEAIKQATQAAAESKQTSPE